MPKGIAFLIWLSCSSLTLGQLSGQHFLDESSSSLPAYVDQDGYLVYSTVINSILQRSNFQRETIVAIDEQTATTMPICSAPNQEHKAMLASAIANYAKVNKVRRHLLPRFSLDKPYEMVQVHGIYLSSIGFNRGKTVAVVSAFAGSGGNYVLVKKNGEWQFLGENWSDYGCAWAS